MARSKQGLPEGTDAILDENGSPLIDPSYGDGIDDAGYGAEPTAEAIEVPVSGGGRRRAALDAIAAETAGIKQQATDKARSFAVQGKEKATGALDGISRAVSDAAAGIDEKVGPQYGDYARRAADAVAGLSTSLQSKEVEEILDDARSFVRKSPAVAIGAAVAIGFVVARLIKSGTGTAETATPTTKPTGDVD